MSSRFPVVFSEYIRSHNRALIKREFEPPHHPNAESGGIFPGNFAGGDGAWNFLKKERLPELKEGGTDFPVLAKFFFVFGKPAESRRDGTSRDFGREGRFGGLGCWRHDVEWMWEWADAMITWY